MKIVIIIGILFGLIRADHSEVSRRQGLIEPLVPAVLVSDVPDGEHFIERISMYRLISFFQVKEIFIIWNETLARHQVHTQLKIICNLRQGNSRAERNYFPSDPDP